MSNVYNLLNDAAHTNRALAQLHSVAVARKAARAVASDIALAEI
jgi:hypothetical protein